MRQRASIVGIFVVHQNIDSFEGIRSGWQAEADELFLEGEGTIEVTSHSAR